MTTADVTFVIDGNDAGLRAAADRSVRSLQRVETAMDEVRGAATGADASVRSFARGADNADASTRKFNVSAEKMGQAVSLVSPRLGELTAKIGGLGAAGGPLVAAGAGVVALGTAWAGTVAHMVSAIRHIDDLTESLTDQQRLALEPYIDNIEQVRDILDSIGGSLTETQIRVLSGFADGIKDIASAVDILASAFNRLDAASEGRVAAWLGRILAMENPLTAYAAVWGTSPGAAVPPDFETLMAGFTGSGEMTEAPGAGGTPPVRAPRRNTASNRPPVARDWLETFGEFDTSLANLRTGIEAELDDLSVRAVDVWIGPEVQAALQARDELSEEYHLREMERIAERRRADQEALTTSLSLASNTIGAMGDLWGTLAESAGASAREVWGIQKAAAVAQAALAIPLAVLEGLKSGGPAAPALAAVYGALAAIQFATVAATPPPKFHSGGVLAPDEETITVRTNERLAVLTSQGADSVARMNAGRPAGEPVAEYYFIDRYGMRRAERFARPRPELAVARRGGW